MIWCRRDTAGCYKEASNRFPKGIFAFVMKKKARMPRTALRYAIEKTARGVEEKSDGEVKGAR